MLTMAPEKFEAGLKSQLSLFDFGPHLRAPVDEARLAVKQSMDFGGLFAALSFFLIVAALALVACCSCSGWSSVRRRSACCWRPASAAVKLRNLLLIEGGIISFIGAVLGALGGVLYTKAALWALGNVWQGAVAGLGVQIPRAALSIVMGILIVHVMAKSALWLASRRILKIPPRELLAGGGVSGAG